MIRAENKKINQVEKIGWGGKSAIWITVLAYLLSQLSVVIPALIFYGLAGEQAGQDILDDNVWATFAIMAFSAIVSFGVIFLFLKKRRLKLSSLGFKKINYKTFLYAFLYGLLYYGLLTIALAVASSVPGFDANQEQEIGFGSVSGWSLIIVFLGLVIIPPLAEEIVFRGFFYRGLKNDWQSRYVLLSGLLISGFAFILTRSYVASLLIIVLTIASLLIAKRSLVFSSALFVGTIFGLAHGQWNVAIDTFVLSLVLAYLYEKTNNLWACVFLHGLKNFIAFLALFIIPLT